MKCNHCSYESTDVFTVCPQCGTPVQASAASTVAERMTQMLKDPLFLVLCILISCATLFSLFVGGVPVIYVLATIFLWLLFAQSRKQTVNAQQLRNLSGTVYAAYVISYVGFAILAVCGVVLLALSSLAGSATPELWEEMYLELNGTYFTGLDLTGDLLSSVLFVLCIVFILVGAVGIVINYFSLGNIHKFLKSVYQSVDAEKMLFVKYRVASTWLIVLGVLSGISAVQSLLTDALAFLSNGAGAAAMIVAGVYIKKYFPE